MPCKSHPTNNELNLGCRKELSNSFEVTCMMCVIKFMDGQMVFFLVNDYLTHAIFLIKSYCICRLTVQLRWLSSMAKRFYDFGLF